MSWITRILPKFSSSDSGTKRRSPIPSGVWTKCPHCDQVLYNEDLVESLMVCPKCGEHMRLSAKERLQCFLDRKGPHEEIGADIAPCDPLGFVDSKPYPERLASYEAKTKEIDALIVMRGTLVNEPIVAASFDFGFMGGSMGSVVGERFVRGVKRSLEEKIPFIVFCASGGARMQEGLISLMQMAKTNSAVAELNREKIPFISVLTDPTMGGVSASFAFMGDVVIAEPGALIGFAGPRVIEQTVREKLPDGFQRAEKLLELGALDMIVDRRNMRSVVFQILEILGKSDKGAL